MRLLLRCFVVGLAATLLTLSSRAEEKLSSVIGALSSTVLSGHVDTSAQWNVGGTNSANVPPAYLQWLIEKRQAALNAFNQEYVATGGYWGNPLLLQARLNDFHLTWVSWWTPITIQFPVPHIVYLDASGYAYFDPPSLFAGSGGTYLMPDLRVVRVPHRTGGGTRR